MRQRRRQRRGRRVRRDEGRRGDGASDPRRPRRASNRGPGLGRTVLRRIRVERLPGFSGPCIDRRRSLQTSSRVERLRLLGSVCVLPSAGGATVPPLRLDPLASRVFLPAVFLHSSFSGVLTGCASTL